MSRPIDHELCSSGCLSSFEREDGIMEPRIVVLFFLSARAGKKNRCSTVYCFRVWGDEVTDSMIYRLYVQTEKTTDMNNFKGTIYRISQNPRLHEHHYPHNEFRCIHQDKMSHTCAFRTAYPLI